MAFDKRLIGLIIVVGFIAGLVGASYTPVSYTHLDVYKRQVIG